MAGRGAKTTSRPTKLETKKNKSKTKAKDYWVSVFFCVIPYDALKSYKKGKFQIGGKKFETVCYKHLGPPTRETGSYKKRSKYDLPLYVDCSDLNILEDCWLDEEGLYPHITLTLLDFYNATVEMLNKDQKLNVHFHIGCDPYCEPLRNGLRQVLTGDGASDIDYAYRRFAQFTRDYEKFMDRFKDKGWTFKVDYSACYNIFLTFCPGLVKEYSPVEKKRRQDEQDKPAPIVVKKKEKDPNKPKPKFRIAGQDEDAEEPVKANNQVKNEQDEAPIVLTKKPRDPNKPRPKFRIAGQDEDTSTKPDDQIKVEILGSKEETDKKQQERANQKERTWDDVNADIDREGKKNPNKKNVTVKDPNGVPMHYNNPYYKGTENGPKIEIL